MWKSLSFVGALVPAIVFAFAGIVKLLDPFSLASFLSYALWLSFPRALTLAGWIAGFEVVLAACLCLFFGRSRIPAYAGLCLLAFFCGLLVEVLWRWPDMATCGCFGSLSVRSNPPTPRVQLAMDLGLMALLGAHLLSFRRSSLEHAE